MVALGPANAVKIDNVKNKLSIFNKASLNKRSPFCNNVFKLRGICSCYSLVIGVLKAERAKLVGTRDGFVSGGIFGDETGALGIEGGAEQATRK